MGMRCMVGSVALAFAALFAWSASAAKCYWVSDANGGSGGWADSTRWRNALSGITPTGSAVTPQDGDELYVIGAATVTDADLATVSKASWVVAYGGMGNGVCTFRISGSYSLPAYLAGTGKVVVESGDVTLTRKNAERTDIVVNGGSLTLPAPSSTERTFGVVTVNAPAVLYLPRVASGYYSITGLKGDGTVEATGDAKQAELSFVGDAAGTTFVFSGSLVGKVAPTLSGAVQYLTKTDNANTGDLRVKSGTLGISWFGGASGTASSFGTSQFWMQAGTDVTAADSTTLRYLGNTHETTAREFQIYTFREEVILDGGDAGVTFTGTFSNNGISGNSLRLALEGSATAEPSSIAASFPGSGSGGVIHIAKRGVGTWLFPASNSAANYNGVFAVEKGTLSYESIAEAGTQCSLGFANALYERYSGALDASRKVPWAYLLGNGTDTATNAALATFEYSGTADAKCSTRLIALNGAARVRNATSNEFDFAGVTAAMAGVNTLVLDGPGVSNVVRNVTNGVGSVSVVKEGAGTWRLDGDVDISGGIAVKEGVLEYRQKQPNYTWFRITITARYSAGSACKLGHIGLFAEDGTEQSLNLAYNHSAHSNADPTRLNPGEVAFGLSRNTGTSSKTSKEVLETLFAPYVQDVNRDMYTGGGDISAENPIVIMLRLPSGAAPVVKYDMITGWYSSTSRPYDATPTQWLIEGSVDGVNWDEVEQEGARNLRYGSGNYWMSDGTRPADGVTNPTGIAIFTQPAEPTNRKMSSVSSLSVAPRTSFLVDGEVTVSRLMVDFATGCGDVAGCRFAGEGTLAVANMPDEQSVFMAVPFASAPGFSNIAGWQLEINGASPRAGKYTVEALSNGLRISRRGLVLNIR